eukprot:1862121-Lingulodinium_polyedra.AAC.1
MGIDPEAILCAASTGVVPAGSASAGTTASTSRVKLSTVVGAAAEADLAPLGAGFRTGHV